ncbi:MAG TPA: hypothetical protein VFR28_05050, partial [Allosphingosinicella sp.]|nr:hypothetical protein [Allosphingosinicella sp.]
DRPPGESRDLGETRRDSSSRGPGFRRDDGEVRDDGCQASCVDWYGNARPIFWGGRTFALLGYELVEGELAGGRIREVGRISFAPAPRQR